MADRTGHPLASLATKLFVLTGKVTIGATGAPTLVTASGQSNGFASITRAAAGDYDVVLQDQWQQFQMIYIELFEAGADDFTFQTAVEDPDASGGGTFSFFANTAGTATELPDGSTLRITILARNSAI